MDGFHIGGDYIKQDGSGNIGKVVNYSGPAADVRGQGGRASAAAPAADVLLVTVNDAETGAVRAELEGLGLHGQVAFGEVNSYVLYGPVHDTVVAHVRSGMGSIGQRASTLTVADAIRDLSPTAVIGLGVAFGIDEVTQPIGRLLLSERLTNYERAKVATSPSGAQLTLERGSSTECSARLIGRFLACVPAEMGIDIQIGEVLSGEKLVDNEDFKRALIERFPEAIGGEMEGAGIQAASGREQVEWIVAKAVCDYASRKSVDRASRQAKASAVAARAVVSVLRQGGLIRTR
jgi:nucleoside phosphorylase